MITRPATCVRAASIALGAIVAFASMDAGSLSQEQRPRFRADVDVVPHPRKETHRGTLRSMRRFLLEAGVAGEE